MTDVEFIVLDASGGGPMLRDCLQSIAGQSVAPRGVIVFDNGSPSPLQVEGVRLLRSATNIGFAAGVNEAYRASSAPFIALVNNDVVLDPGWLASVRQAMDADPRAAAVQCVIRRDEQTLDGAGIDISDGTFRQIGHGLPTGSPLPPAWGVSATATLYRRAALGDRVFDPQFFAYYEDVELCARLHAAGWRTVVLPVIKATHRGSQSAPLLGAARAKRLRTRNRYFVARMHRGVGRRSSLLLEDAKLLMQGRSSVRGIIEGLCTRLS